MQLFRVKDCKQMGKKMSRLDFASISSRLGFTFILYNIKLSSYIVMWWVVLLSLFFYLIGLVGVRHSRTFSRYHYDAFLWGDYSVEFRAPRFLGGGGLPLALRNAVLIYFPRHCCEWAVIILSVIWAMLLP